MYLKQFSEKLFRSANKGLIAYFSVNIILIAAIIIAVLISIDMNVIISVLLGIIGGIAIYTIFIAIMMSSVGEYLFRMDANCSNPDEEVKNYIEPIFNSVYEKVKKTDPSISPNVKLYQNKKDKSINAFAMGRNTICVCSGIMSLPPEEIESVLAHEFGHLSHYDTTLSQGVVVGNLFLTLLMNIGPIAIRIGGLLIKGLFFVLSFIPIVGSLISILSSGISFVIDLMAQGFSFIFVNICKLWMKVGFYLCQKSSRDCEFESDAFACQLGYGNGLISLFSRPEMADDIDSADDPIFDMLARSHPPMNDRIEKIYGLINK